VKRVEECCLQIEVSNHGGEKLDIVMFKRGKWEALIVNTLFIVGFATLIFILITNAGADWR